MPLDKEELKKLSPRERLKKLKEVEEETKTELEEAAALIKETEKEVNVEDISSGVAVPDTQPIDISELFGSSEEGKKIEDLLDVGGVKYEAGFDETDNAGYLSIGQGGGGGTKLEDTFDIKTYAAGSESETKKATASKNVIDHVKKYSRG